MARSFKDLSDKQKHKFSKVMREYAKGTLRTASGKKVTDRKQAVAIAFSEASRV